MLLKMLSLKVKATLRSIGRMTLQDYQADSGVDRFEVLEYWGVMDMKTIEEHDIEIPEELESADELQVNIWICNDRVIRSVLNPFKPVRSTLLRCTL